MEEENKDDLVLIHSTDQFKLSKVDGSQLKKLVSQECTVFVIMKVVPRNWLIKSDIVIDIVLRNKVYYHLIHDNVITISVPHRMIVQKHKVSVKIFILTL